MSCMICGRKKKLQIRHADNTHIGVCATCVSKVRSTLTYCAYCGEEFPIDDNAKQVSGHIASCPKHPMRKLEVKINILKSQIREALEMSYVPEGTLLYASMMKSVGE